MDEVLADAAIAVVYCYYGHTVDVSSL